ncbi:hypothetical protein DPEC_G00216280 [Dallia pectoralis]|uniref:Uncharacterized protein n=1 Tax=Dallia pectoralis TaxID=75939 RepID=A0ACC2G2W9_DALPE|nr:hypothetical protein DPEC_G00216280 [Dallia pectoralis]
MPLVFKAGAHYTRKQVAGEMVPHRGFPMLAACYREAECECVKEWSTERCGRRGGGGEAAVRQRSIRPSPKRVVVFHNPYGKCYFSHPQHAKSSVGQVASHFSRALTDSS